MIPLRHRRRAWGLGLALWAIAPGAVAEGFLAPGFTSEETPSLAVGLDREIDLGWHPALRLRLAGSLLLLPGRNGDEDNAALVVTPAWRYNASDRVFFEAGVGGGLFLHTRLSARELSTAWQFEDRLAAGFRLDGGGELGLSAAHYSNSGIKRPNEGFEIYSLSYRQRL